jgi:hypothetical protein
VESNGEVSQTNVYLVEAASTKQTRLLGSLIMSHEAARGSSAAAPAEPSSAYLGCHSALALALYLLDILLNSAVEFGDFTAQGQSDENTQNTIITMCVGVSFSS